MKSLQVWLLAVGLATVQVSYAEVRLPKMFGTGMVLQRRQPIPVWGWADAGEKVTVTLGKQTKMGQADKTRQWRLRLDPMEAGGPYQLIVKGRKNSLRFDDVLLGEVWICSGQSNMEFALAAAKNAPAEIRAAKYPKIRQFLVRKRISTTPETDLNGEWAVCSPETAPKFTAVGYFFARNLFKELNVPIGLVNTTWGGTHSETWTSREGMARDAELAKTVAKLPITDQDVQRDGRERIRRRLVAHQNGQLPTLADERGWVKPDFDARDWRTLRMPGNWEWAGLPGFDGVVWLRREVDIPHDADLRSVTFATGASDDIDSTYVNGQLIGTTGKPGEVRRYLIPNGVLKSGCNVITVRLDDAGGAGGLTGGGNQFQLAGNNFDQPLAGDWQYRIARVYPSTYGAGPNTYPTLLYNAMVRPLMPYAIKGVIWYQGESNADRAMQYRRSFPLMIRDWREQWARAGQPPGTGKTNVTDFPFLFVQLANFGPSDNSHGSNWAELREAQTLALKLPNTGMAVTCDIGEASDIHPRNKQDVGDRLAAEALRIAYGQNRVSSGPIFEGMTVDGNRIAVAFKNVGGGLVAKDKYGYLKGFEVAGDDQKFVPARAFIVGNKVLVNASTVTMPIAVRYGWANDNGEVNLYNKEGFPAVPFRTDSWKTVTENVKFGEPAF
ncbi:MAG: sialate O-acetylesterase [Bacteroidetes bacterium]|nr:sialate O-acetylesterase [Fibrella sp.]